MAPLDPLDPSYWLPFHLSPKGPSTLGIMAVVLCADHQPANLGLDHPFGPAVRRAAYRPSRISLIKPQLYISSARHQLFSSPPSPPNFLFSTAQPTMVSSPRNPFLDDSGSDSTAAEPLLFPSAKTMPATHDLFDVLAKSLNDDDDGLMRPPPTRYRTSSYTERSMTPATPMTVPPSPSSPNKRARKRARMDHGDR